MDIQRILCNPATTLTELTVALNQANPDEDYRDDKGNTPLIIFSKQGDSDAVIELLNFQSDTEKKNGKGRSAFYKACKFGQDKVVQILLDKTWDNLSILTACRRGYLQIIDLFFDKIRKNQLVGEPLGRESKKLLFNEMLNCSSRGGHVEIAKRILDFSKEHEYEFIFEKLCSFAIERGDLVSTRCLLAVFSAEKDKETIRRLFEKAVLSCKVEIARMITKERVFSIEQNALFELLRDTLPLKNLDLVEFLLKKGALVRKIDANGKSILFYAAEIGFKEALVRILEYGGNLAILAPNKVSPLMTAARYNQVDVLEYLLDKQEGAINQADDYGYTLAHFCAHYDAIDTLKKIYEKGAKINELDRQRYSPLHVAIFEKKKNAAMFLLERLQEEELKGYSKLNLLLKDALCVDSEIAKRLIEKTQRYELGLIQGIQRNHLEFIQFILEKKDRIDPKIRENDRTFLMQACQRNVSKEILECLLDVFGDIDEMNDVGENALIIFIFQQNLIHTEVLLKRRANPFYANEGKCDAFIHAIEGGNREIFRKLMSYIEEEKKQPSLKQEYLTKAAAFGQVKNVNSLLKNGLDPNPSRYNLPIVSATRNNHLKIVKILLNAGADPLKKDLSCNQSALEIAEENNNVRIVECIKMKLISEEEVYSPFFRELSGEPPFKKHRSSLDKII